jgi:hypothetical protein
MYASWDGSHWSIENVDDDARHKSLALDSNGYPHISYFVAGYNNYLKYATYTGTGWTTSIVDNSAVVGSYNSLALDSSNHPHIAYSDETNKTIKYARWTGSIWEKEIVHSSPILLGYTSIALDSSNLPHISYASIPNDTSLHYARWTGSIWESEVVDAHDVCDTSLALDSSNRPHISYSSSNGAGSLYYATIFDEAYADYSDAPSPYPETFHGVTEYVHLGNYVDKDLLALQDPQATGDDLDHLDDDDGVQFLTDSIAGHTSSVRVQTYVLSGHTGYLQAWIDFNRDFDWADAGEHIITDFSLGAGVNYYDLQFNVPAGATPGQTFARFIINMGEGIDYDQITMDGEVEDYMLEIKAPPSPMSVGGEVIPINRIAVLTPWLLLIFTLMIGGTILVLSRHKGS